MPNVHLTIDGVAVEVPSGTFLLDAARAAGINIPTLCYMKDVHRLGGCRICVVEVEGNRTLMASCVQPVAQGMIVHTRSERVREARKLVLELLLSDHDADCQTCSRSGDCELQEIARALNATQVRFSGEHHPCHLDTSTPALVRDSSKCILCRRCVTVCSEIQATRALWPQDRGFRSVAAPAFGHDLASVPCLQCGQCAAVCPTAAIAEKGHIAKVWKALSSSALHVIVQTAPAIRASLGECFGLPSGSQVTGRMTAALRRLGFRGVFDTNFAADLTIMEEGTELLVRLRDAQHDGRSHPLPQFTSCCPGWIKYAEYFHPELLPHLSTTKSPQQMFGALAKTYYARKVGIAAEKIFVVSVMPCTAKKYEAQRPEMNSSGIQDVDAVLTTRELGAMIRESGIDFLALGDESMDQPLGLGTGAADIFAHTGGVMEAALRTVWCLVTGLPFPFEDPAFAPIAGLEGVKELELRFPSAVPPWDFLAGQTLRVAIAHGIANAERLLQRVASGETQYHFVEVMSCPGGCIGGGGQPRFTTDEVRLARIRGIKAEDAGKKLRHSHENPDITRLYQEFLGVPMGELSHRLLHTHYHPRSVIGTTDRSMDP